MDKVLRILILGDVPDDAELIKHELHKAGIKFSSKCVETREDFIEGIKDLSPDIILSDYMLPSFNGMAALELTQELAQTIPFIIVTGSINEETAVKCIKAGAEDYVLKNHLNRIGSVVKSALEREKVRKEKERVEEALKTSETSYRRLFETARDGILLLDADTGRITDVNPHLIEMLGYSHEEFLGKKLWDIGLFRDIAESQAGFQNLQRGEYIRYEHLPLETKDGRSMDVEFVSNVYRVGHQKVIQCNIRDITERKQAEKEAVADLERSNRELQQFAYVASHDLQEPLRMVASYVQLLAKRYQDKLDADANEFIGYAVDGANRMQEMINDLLSYSRIETRGKSFETVDCTAILNQALTNLKIAIEESSAVITHDPLPTVMGDELQLIQLFQNLIGNAVKFRGKETPHIHISATHESRKTMDDGRKTIDQLPTARLSSPQSQFSELKEGWVFSVRDNGIGIDPQHKERIFNVFQRLHGRDYSGTGIGLSICKRVVERYDGNIWVESEPEKGSTFYFTIPDR